MYLSRLILNPRSRRVQREIAEPYQMHRTVMRAFQADLAQGAERVLFRLDVEPHAGRLSLLVQSWELPDWSSLGEPKALGYLLPTGEANPSVKPFDLHLAAGQVLAFRLRANPTVKQWLLDDKGEKQPKRFGLYRAEEQIAWLRRKGEQGGFSVLSVRTGNQDTVKGTLKRDSRQHSLALLAVQFDGLLQVADPDRLRETARQGIGSGKGFGFGLLSLARPV